MRLFRDSQRKLEKRAGRLRRRAQMCVCPLKKGRGNMSKRVREVMDKVVQLDIHRHDSHWIVPHHSRTAQKAMMTNKGPK